RPQAVLASARADEGARHRGGDAEAGGPDKSTPRQRHDSSWLRPSSEVVAGRSTLRNTATAFCISSIVPIEIRTWLFSNGGKSRPTTTPCLAHASRNSLAGRPTSVKTKLACETPDRQPMSSSALTVNARTAV